MIKPLSFLLIFILAVVNFIIILIPLFLVMAPFFFFAAHLTIKMGLNILYMLVAVTSAIMLFYLFADMIFGFTVRTANRGAKPYEKMKDLIDQGGVLRGHHGDLGSVFREVQQKFGKHHVKLYISPSEEVNAFAVGSLRKKTITVTLGLINTIKSNVTKEDQYLDAMRGILGHEMSHLVNADYLPGLLMLTCESANHLVANIIRFLFIIVANCLRIIPLLGKSLYRIVMYGYNIMSFLIHMFFKLIFMPIYTFMQRFLSRSIEYRCDRESGYAFGGRRIAYALAMIGKKSYINIFSTHPSTQSRVKKAESVNIKGGEITPSIFSTLSNLCALGLVIAICGFSWQTFNYKELRSDYEYQIILPIMDQIDAWQIEIDNLIYQFKNR